MFEVRLPTGFCFCTSPERIGFTLAELLVVIRMSSVEAIVRSSAVAILEVIVGTTEMAVM